MDFLYFIFVYTILLSLPKCVLLIPTSTENDFYKQLEKYEVQIAKELSQELEPVELKSYQTYWDKLWYQRLGVNSVLTVDIFDRVYVLQDKTIMALAMNVPSLNETSTLKESAQLRQERPVKFVRTFKWKATLYLLACYDDDPCSLYTGTPDMQLTLRQKVKPKGRAMDASFFTQANRLYLVVADNIDQFPVSSMIYHWTGTYMDVVTEVESTGAVSVTTFNYKQSTIIVFAQSDAQIGSKVYEFRGTTAEAIQFLVTDKPICVRHFQHGAFDYVLLINENGPAEVFWFRSGKNKKLLMFHELPTVRPFSSVKIVDIASGTFAFAACGTTLQLFTLIGMSEWILVNVANMNDNEAIVDMSIQVDGTKMNVVLVTKNGLNHMYGVEVWKLHITENLRVDERISDDAPTKCFAELIRLLKSRMPNIEKAKASWPTLYPSDENQTIIEELKLPSIDLGSSTVGTIHIVVSEDIATPMEIQQRSDDMNREINELSSLLDKIPRRNVKNNFTNDVVVDGDVFFDEFDVDSIDVDTFNDIDVRLDNVVSSKGDQNFTMPLIGKNVTVKHFEIDSICGIPFEHWAVKSDTVKTVLPDMQDEQIQIINDTIFVSSDIVIQNLRTKKLNDIDVDKFLREVFIIGKQQEIKGNIIYQDKLSVVNLTVETLNGIPVTEFMTKTTEQSFDDVNIKAVKIGDLYVDSINGVLVSEAARISRANVIKGKVRLTNLHVTEELNIKTKNVVLDYRPTQIYDNITIIGNVSLDNVNFMPGSTLYISNLKVNPERIFEDLWTKSTNQTIKQKVFFPAGVTVDHLNAKLINGFEEDDFLYTTVEDIPEKFGDLHFEDIHVNGSILANGDNTSLFEIGEELIIHQPLHLTQLNVNDLFTEVVNDVPVNVIINNNEPVKIDGNTNFLAIRAGTVHVNNLNANFLNKRNVPDHLKTLLHVDDDFNVRSVKTSKFVVRDLTVETINGINMSHLIELKDITSSDLEDIVIDGDLIVENNLEANEIGGLSPEMFLKLFMEKDIVIGTEEVIDNLVVYNLTTKLLHGLVVENFFKDVLLKSRNQTFSGQFSVNEIITSNVNAKYINDQATSKIVWTDAPISISGDVTFTDLFVGGDLATDRLNGQNAKQLYNGLLTVPTTKIDDLRINGSVSWTVSRDSTDSLTYLLENAVTKNTDQHIRGETTFNETVTIETFIGEFKGIEKIRSIVTDTVLNDVGTVTISGRKTFKQNVSVNSLTVLGDIGIASVNGRDIVEFNASMVRKYQDGIIEGPVIFREDVSIHELLTNESVIHGGPIIELALANKILPGNVVFQDLHVRGNVYLKYIGDIEFNEFVENRVTLNGTHEILAPVQFNGIVQVTGNAVVGTMNGIKTSDLIFNPSSETQVITGAKTFIQNLIVNGSVNAPLVNDVDISAEFENGVVNDKDVDIFGDLIFENTVTILNNTSVSGLVNDIDLSNLVKETNTRSNRSLTSIIENQAIITERMYRAKEICESLPNLFFYLETDENLMIEVPNIDKVDVVHFGEVTRLNMYGQRDSSVCGLPVSCVCTVQYTVELSRKGHQVSKLNESNIRWEFHEPNEAFGINVETNVTSNGVGCTRKEFMNEFTTISWVVLERSNTNDLVENRKYITQKIKGFPKDVQFFLYNDEVYVIMAIYYNVDNNTHRTHSLVYKLNFNYEKLTLVQKIPTNGAWSIEVFQIGEADETYMLIGCYETPTESLLFRFDKTVPEFTPVRSFPTRSRFVRSLSQEKYHFVLLDDPTVNGVQIYEYDARLNHFHHYQSLLHDSRVNGIERFYVGEYANSDAYVIVTTEGGQFYIYEYMFLGKFQLAVQYSMDNVQVMVPFSHRGDRYIFAGTKFNSTIFRIVQQGPG